jgi:hypothetical protein
MCQVIRRYAFILFLSVGSLTPYGCILHGVTGPGYSVSVSLLEQVRLDEGDVAFLDRMAV